MSTKTCIKGKCTVLENGGHTGPGCGCECHMEKRPGYSPDLMDQIMNPEYERLRDLARELVYEAKKLNVDPTLMIFGVTWNFEEAFKSRLMRAFK